MNFVYYSTSVYACMYVCMGYTFVAMWCLKVYLVGMGSKYIPLRSKKYNYITSFEELQYIM